MKKNLFLLAAVAVVMAGCSKTETVEMPDSAVNRLWFEQGCWSCVELGEGKARLLYFNK